MKNAAKQQHDASTQGQLKHRRTRHASTHKAAEHKKRSHRKLARHQQAKRRQVEHRPEIDTGSFRRGPRLNGAFVIAPGCGQGEGKGRRAG